jgi:hypothetical protein
MQGIHAYIPETNHVSRVYTQVIVSLSVRHYACKNSKIAERTSIKLRLELYNDLLTHYMKANVVSACICSVNHA